MCFSPLNAVGKSGENVKNRLQVFGDDGQSEEIGAGLDVGVDVGVGGRIGDIRTKLTLVIGWNFFRTIFYTLELGLRKVTLNGPSLLKKTVTRFQ